VVRQVGAVEKSAALLLCGGTLLSMGRAFCGPDSVGRFFPAETHITWYFCHYWRL